MKYLIVFLLVISKSVSTAQVSKKIYEQLPDTLKPAKFNNISYQELKRIIRYSSSVRYNTPNENRELEQLCSKFTPLVKNLTTNDAKLEHFRVVLKYWFNRYTSRDIDTKSNILDSANKYVEIYRNHILNGSKNYDSNLARYYILKGSIMNVNKNFTEGYSYINQAMQVNKMMKDNEQISFGYSVLSYMHNELELYTQAIMYCDSALLFDCKKNNLSYNLATKSYAFCSLFASTGLKEHSDSAIINVNKLVRSTNAPKYRSTAFDILARLNYHQGNYLKSIAYTDSSLALARGKELNEDQINTLLYKALCLIKIGRKKEGLDLVKKNRIQGSGPEAGKILQELYKSEKEKGNLSMAISYLERLQEFQDSSRSLKSRGQIFEIQQKYNAASKDLNILKLKNESKRNKLIASGIGLIIWVAGMFLIIRFRNNLKKTRLLVAQIHEQTEFQIMRIEHEKEKERQRIGQDLHDDLSGSISAGVRFLRMMAEERLEDKNKVRLLEISDMLEKSYEKVRSKSHELYLEERDGNFWDELDRNIDLFFAATNINVNLCRETSGLTMTPEEKTTILLIVRESISNVIKHSKASEVEILIYSESEKLILEISDNGKGMSPKLYSKNLGLKSILDRVLRLNGAMKITERNPTGTNFRAEISIVAHSQFVSA